ncbi:MBL fold metallo-hydrolase [Bacillus sp. MRMR6]|uniref:MBL fold metallo-hydrolase n=1 Tax=Bacillus sp. MRMR6 TaxID=1928617 RepID=UPI0009531054|nr:MBL fold metallo-hydrolase [Bacillus sp. MRMR6]OLS38547.1 MBL fold metallo-hydrolase [Bacillus sp. MRMR6]
MINVFEKEGVTCVEAGYLRSGRKEGLVYNFLVDGMLIDTGAARDEADLISFYKEYEFDFVLLTHSHEDHVGTAAWIQENREVPIYIHPKGIEVCRQPGQYPKYRQFAWGVRKVFKPLPLENESFHSRTVEWKAIYTPGHADDHLALYQKDTGILFSGDLFLNPNPKVLLSFESIPVIMDSLRRLLSYDFGTLFCSHAGYVENGRKMLRRKLDYLESITGEVLDLHKQGLSIDEIDKKLFPVKHMLVSISEGEFNSLHIVSSIINRHE